MLTLENMWAVMNQICDWVGQSSGPIECWLSLKKLRRKLRRKELKEPWEDLWDM